MYKLLLPKASKLYITKINQNFEGDAFFPEINQEEWEIEIKRLE
ncbi:MAG: dihydrofolate reductase [Clostridia bacterium]